MLQQQKVGVIGMGIMGRNLALNLERRGYNVAIYNRSKDKTDIVITNNLGKHLIPYYSIKEFVYYLNNPRFIFLMITAGAYVDDILQLLLPYLDAGDIVIDGGNSFYKDTIYRNATLSKRGINFIGVGISGGQAGALNGPSLMPGGQKGAYDMVYPVLKNIAARVNNESCVSYIGPDGAGHYVKMIHNSIEYGDMQLIAEIYFLFKKIFSLGYKELGIIFNTWNKGELNSYLIDITSCIFMKEEARNCCILESILDIADNKGTGVWAGQNAFDLNVPSTLLVESVFARYLSTLKMQRIQASKILSGPSDVCSMPINASLIEQARKALYFSKIILYAQGFYQLRVASDKYNWNLNLKEIARIFLAGCIIRAKFLEKIIEIYSQTPEISNLLLAPYCVNIANNYQQSLRDVVACGIQHGISMPVLSSAISYYDGYRSAVLPANLIQAQRDFFGAHTYMRVDKNGVFHTDWLKI